MQNVWLRLGVTIQLSRVELEELLQGDMSQVVRDALQDGRVMPDGDTYIPAEAIEHLNAQQGTSYPVRDYGCDMHSDLLPWRIWFRRLDEDGKCYASGVDLKCYAHRSNALRAAKRKWADVPNVQWKVSRINPWPELP